MKTLNVCFVGYGSIAKRHVKNLLSICKSKSIEVNIDLLRHRYDTKDSIKHIRNVYFHRLPKDARYDIIFVTNPTSKHYQTIKENINRTKMFFVEKPLVSYEYISKIKSLKINPNKIYVACPMRYKRIMSYAKKYFDKKKILCARILCSSYLPKWRVGVDYKETYSARKKLGGGVRLDLIHEMDYIRYLFGDPIDIKCSYGKYSDLSIDTEDLAIYILEYKDKIIELHLDYFGKKNQRNIVLFTTNDTINIDLLKNKVIFYNLNKVLSFNEKKNDLYKEELSTFLKIFYKKDKNTNNLFNALETVVYSKGA